jgi:hypothetical protein
MTRRASVASWHDHQRSRLLVRREGRHEHHRVGASKIDGYIRDQLVSGAITSWSDTVELVDGAKQGELAQEDAREIDEAALRAWINALDPPGIDITNENAISNLIERLHRNDQPLYEAYKDYAAQVD